MSFNFSFREQTDEDRLNQYEFTSSKRSGSAAVIDQRRKKKTRLVEKKSYNGSICSHRNVEFMLSKENTKGTIDNCMRQVDLLNDYDISLQTSPYVQAWVANDIVYIDTKINPDLSEIQLGEVACMLCGQSQCLCTLRDMFEQCIQFCDLLFLLPSNFELGSVSIIKGYLLLLKNYVVRVASINDRFLQIYSSNKDLSDQTFSFFRFYNGKFQKNLVYLQCGKYLNENIMNYSYTCSETIFCARRKWRVKQMCDHTFCDLENKTLMYNYEFQRKFFRSGFGPRKQINKRGKCVLDLDECTEINIKSTQDIEVAVNEICIDQLPDTIPHDFTRRDIGIYVKPQIHTAYNGFCYNELSLFNGAFLPYKIIHEKKFPMMKWFARVYLPGMVISLSSMHNNAMKHNFFSDPGIPFVDVDGNMLQEDFLSQCTVSENFVKANTEFHKIISSISTQRQTKERKRSAAQGKLCGFYGLIGIRNRISNCIAVLCSVTKDEKFFPFNWMLRPPCAKCDKKNVVPEIDMIAFYEAFTNLFRFLVVPIDCMCSFCEDRPESLNDAWGNTGNGDWLSRVDDNELERVRSWIYSKERFDALSDGCGFAKDVCIDCALLYLAKRALVKERSVTPNNVMAIESNLHNNATTC